MTPTAFQQRIEPGRYYSGPDLRAIVLEMFPAGQQAEREGQPLLPVHFQGLMFIETDVVVTRPQDALYRELQFGEQRREVLLGRWIPDRREGYGSWVRIFEVLQTQEAEKYPTTMFDFSPVDRGMLSGYHVRSV